MGSTYSVGKKAAAIVGPDGTIFYVLFEQTYESNVHPHNPHWCAIGFGTAADCMARIVKGSSACEGGALKGRGGNITPSIYIRQWREALANPVEFSGNEVTGEFGDGVYKIENEKREAVAAILARHGHGGIVGNKVTIDVRQQPQLFVEIQGEVGMVWRFIDRNRATAIPASWAAYAPAADKVDVPHVDVFCLSPEKQNWDLEHWIRLDGALEHTGWEYSTIGRLIHRIAIDAERKAPGSAEYAIRKIREFVKNKRQFSMDQRIKVDPGKIKDDWRKPQFRDLARKLALSEDETIETTFRKARAAGAEYQLCGMPDEAVEFLDLPGAASSGEQQLLLAA